MPDYCVVIKIYNEFEMLEGCIQSLASQIMKPKQVIIVDDGSPDEGVSKEILRLKKEYLSLNIELLRLSLKSKPNLDTVGRTWMNAWQKIVTNGLVFNYFAMLDSDTRLMDNYYSSIIDVMEENARIIVRQDALEYIEKINIGAKLGRKDARGSGKVIRTSFLTQVERDFPEIDWDTWINTKAKVRGFKSPQIDNIFMYQERPTTRVIGKDNHRNGRLTYHFGYNPILLLLKLILAKKGAISIFKGYIDARKKKWKLEDEEVRKYFGWKFFFHL
ncbi:MAG: glycosyltransferase family 2 protein [Candidatus Hodarchaeales archaeon]|jgi:glycosyltransferase involved in cell wall biosynthesis